MSAAKKLTVVEFVFVKPIVFPFTEKVCEPLGIGLVFIIKERFDLPALEEAALSIRSNLATSAATLIL